MEYVEKCIGVYGNISLQELLLILSTATYIDVYTDGSTQYNQISKIKMSGIGVYISDDIYISKLVDTCDNNVCELMACIEALKLLRGKHHFVNIFTDSRLVYDGLNGNCNKQKFPLFEELESLVSLFIDVKVMWVKGHSNNEGNEKADQLSRRNF